MISLETYASRIGADGRSYVRASIYADNKPEPMPRTGEGIEGIDDNAAIDIGSSILVLDSSEKYIMGEDWQWYKWQTSGGGGGGGATIRVGETTTLEAGQPATVTNTGTETDAIFNFGIPKGADGDAATISVKRTETEAAGEPAAVTNEGTEQNAEFVFKIPKGADGAPATISVKRTETADAGTDAEVTNEGTEQNAEFVFKIPKGADGQNPNITIGETTTLEAGQPATVTNTGSEIAPILNFGIPKGKDGEAGGGGDAPIIGTFEPGKWTVGDKYHNYGRIEAYYASEYTDPNEKSLQLSLCSDYYENANTQKIIIAVLVRMFSEEARTVTIGMTQRNVSDTGQIVMSLNDSTRPIQRTATSISIDLVAGWNTVEFRVIDNAMDSGEMIGGDPIKVTFSFRTKKTTETDAVFNIVPGNISWPITYTWEPVSGPSIKAWESLTMRVAANQLSNSDLTSPVFNRKSLNFISGFAIGTISSGNVVAVPLTIGSSEAYEGINVDAHNIRSSDIRVKALTMTVMHRITM